jgi:Concanavalin A-like lectin/glucanases superfamily/Domain of unknown function (DUF2341)
VGTRAILGAAGAIVAALACAPGTFVCEGDDDCTKGGARGVCEPTGACSFPDDACPSGRRYGAYGSDGLANKCVASDLGTSSSSGADDVASSIETTLETTAPGESSSAMPSSSDEGESGSSSCPAGWWDCAWSRRIALTVAGTGSEPLADVPLLVLLGPSRIDTSAVASAGEDLRFVDAGGTLVPHEIERWSVDDVAVVWISVASLGDATTSLWLYHGNPAASDLQDAAAVWGDPFVGVWHLSGGASDSTGSANHGIVGEGVAEVSGWAGDAQEFFDVGDRITVPSASSLDNVFFGGGTVSAWVRLDTFGGNLRGRIADNTADSSAGWMFYASQDTGGELGWRYGYEAGQSIWHGPGRSISTDRWYHVAASFTVEQNAAPRMYVDGVEVEVSAPDVVPATPPVDDVGHDLLIGDSDVENRWFDGRIDELRVERTIRSPAWIAVQAQSMRDELIEYGVVERVEDLQ